MDNGRIVTSNRNVAFLIHPATPPIHETCVLFYDSEKAIFNRGRNRLNQIVKMRFNVLTTSTFRDALQRYICGELHRFRFRVCDGFILEK